jgi:hypothetical protein
LQDRAQQALWAHQAKQAKQAKTGLFLLKNA